jgi:carbonic anhydrase
VAREGQKPHALFITCADSRIDPELITGSGPGEIFVCRNIGNLVPPYHQRPEDVAAIVEYAIAGLQVCHIVVCGHSNCGAMIGLLHPQRVAAMPIVRAWLRSACSVSEDAPKCINAPDGRPLLEQSIEENVLLQLHHLQTHPCVAERLAQGMLALSGWVYDIGHGAVRVYNEEQRKFLSVGSDGQAASGGAAGWP